MHREYLRQLVAVSARFENLDLGHGIAAIKEKLAKTIDLPAGVRIEFGGLYQQQQESCRNLSFVLLAALILVYAVLMLEFRTFLEPPAIWMGALLALFGVAAALWLTGTTLNIVSILGAIIAMGIVHKNGILMFDYVSHFRSQGLPLVEAMIQSGRRRLRPVLMTSLTTFLGLLPLAYGIGAGADMLRPMAIAVIGSLFMSLLLSLVATPVFYTARRPPTPVRCHPFVFMRQQPNGSPCGRRSNWSVRLRRFRSGQPSCRHESAVGCSNCTSLKASPSAPASL